MCSSWFKSTFDRKKKWGSKLETFSFSGEKQKSPCQCGFIGDFRMWIQVCWQCVTLSQNTSKGWKIRNIWKGGLEEWELHSCSKYIYIYFLIGDLLTFERWRPVLLTGGWLAFMGSIRCYLPPIQTLTHPPSELNWISYKTFYGYLQKK